ncbi:hypothetical protein P3S67_012718 [Capsicum chacoense]
MAPQRTKTRSPMAIVTPASGIQQQLAPLIFGNFLPHSIQSICEDKELESAMEMRPDPAGRRNSRSPEDSQFPRHLQFSEAGTSSHTTPDVAGTSTQGALVGKPKKKVEIEKEKIHARNRSFQIGQPLTYIPPSTKGEKILVEIDDEDIYE